jgi:hypothetical protein
MVRGSLQASNRLYYSDSVPPCFEHRMKSSLSLGHHITNVTDKAWLDNTKEDQSVVGRYWQREMHALQHQVTGTIAIR